LNRFGPQIDLWARISLRRRVPARHSHRKRRFATSSFLKKTEVLKRGSLARDRRPGQSPGGSEATPAARVMVRKALAAVTEARQLASCAEGTSTTATRCGASSHKGRTGSRVRIEQTAQTSAPPLTLDTPRASAGAAESAVSEKPRAPPDCDVNDLTEQVRHRAPFSQSAMLIQP